MSKGKEEGNSLIEKFFNKFEYTKVRYNSFMNTPLLDVKNLTITFPKNTANWLAIENLSFQLAQKEVVGLVGESGCGKSLTANAILGLLPEAAQIQNGQILFNGTSLTMLDAESYRKYRGVEIALIPQDPMTALNPVYSVGEQLAEVLVTHKGLSWKLAKQQAISLLDMVKIPYAKDRINDYPHQFSGGMRQRVMIAMALSCHPKLLIADEPTTALDVTVQAQILDLMRELQQDFDTAILLITHDLGVVADICDRINVMYAGLIVETASIENLFKHPMHPYTQGLMTSIPKSKKEKLQTIPGQPPGLRLQERVNSPNIGCTFAARCTHREDNCETNLIELRPMSTSQTVRCILAEQINH